MAHIMKTPLKRLLTLGLMLGPLSAAAERAAELADIPFALVSAGALTRPPIASSPVPAVLPAAEQVARMRLLRRILTEGFFHYEQHIFEGRSGYYFRRREISARLELSAEEMRAARSLSGEHTEFTPRGIERVLLVIARSDAYRTIEELCALYTAAASEAQRLAPQDEEAAALRRWGRGAMYWETALTRDRLVVLTRRGVIQDPATDRRLEAVPERGGDGIGPILRRD